LGLTWHQLRDLVKEGKIEWQSVAEACDVVPGRAPARMSAEETIVFKASGGGFGDSAFANWIYERARQKGLRQEWNFH
jgi:ornithine cyclodeaminase/alanine dehydrogenase-like protein (mu-crystallin family)